MDNGVSASNHLAVGPEQPMVDVRTVALADGALSALPLRLQDKPLTFFKALGVFVTVLLAGWLAAGAIRRTCCKR